MRLPLPGPSDVRQVLGRGADSFEHLLAAGPRVLALLADAEQLVARAGRLVDDIDATRRSADEVVARTDAVVTRADGLVSTVGPLNDRLTALLDGLEPSLTKLQPVLERLADTTDPAEVDALVQLVDQLPRLAEKMESDIMPVLDSLSSVSPDLHDLLDVSRELNEMLAKLPGLGRVKRRIDEEQAAQGRG